MSRRLVGLALMAWALIACSGAPAATPAPGATATPGGVATQPPAATDAPDGVATQPPAATDAPPTSAPNAGDVEALVRALVPPGATEIGEFQAGGMYQLTLTSTMTVDQLEAFWDERIPSQGMTLTGKFTSGGVLTIAITNPDGGIVAAPDGDGGVGIVISLGTSV